MDSASLDIQEFQYSSSNTSMSPIILKDIQATLQTNQLVSLIGISGSGKTTILLCFAGLSDGFMVGNVCFRIDGENLNVSEAQRRGVLGFVGTDDGLVPWRTIRENFYIPCQLNAHLKQPSEAHIEDSLKLLALPLEVLHMYPDQLSHGMRRRVALISATLFDPRFLFLDEPFEGLDVYNRQLLKSFLKVAATNSRCGILFSTHDLEVASEISKSVVLVRPDGSIRIVDPAPLSGSLEKIFLEEVQDQSKMPVAAGSIAESQS